MDTHGLWSEAMKISAQHLVVTSILAIAAVAAFVQALNVQVPLSSVPLTGSHDLLHAPSPTSVGTHTTHTMATPYAQMKLAGDSLTARMVLEPGSPQSSVSWRTQERDCAAITDVWLFHTCSPCRVFTGLWR